MTIIFPSPIFALIHSRRLGVSLGINLLPEDGKVCSFDCIYCECGFNAERRTKKLLPTREEVRTALEEKLKDMQANGSAPDVLTFAGNGEPTAHPYFPEIIEDTLALRDHYFPNAKVMQMPNVIATPHLGASTEESEDNCAVMAVKELMDYLDNGNIKNSVNFPNCDMGVCTTVGRLALLHKNVPNMIGQISSILASTDMNIANMTNKSRDKYAYTLVDLETKADAATIEKLKAIQGMMRVRVIK